MVIQTLAGEELGDEDRQSFTAVLMYDVGALPMILGEEWVSFVNKLSITLKSFGNVVDFIVPLSDYAMFCVTFSAVRRRMPGRDLRMRITLHEDLEPKTYTELVALAHVCDEMSWELDFVTIPTDHVPGRMEAAVKRLVMTARHVVFQYPVNQCSKDPNPQECFAFPALVHAYIRRCYRKPGSVQQDRVDCEIRVCHSDGVGKTVEWVQTNRRIMALVHAFRAGSIVSADKGSERVPKVCIVL
jgi:hypothetical protein